jgi:HAD superfamily hydrolase (TIGR01509 family)
MVGTNIPATMQMLFDAAGVSPTETDLADGATWINDQMVAAYREQLPWRPGAQEALRVVRASGVPTALVTSTDRRLVDIVLDAMGRELFDVTVCGDEVDGRTKPDPWPYRLAASILGVEITRSVAIEDSPSGVAAASSAGATVLVVPCDVEVEPGERRVFRDSLVGLTIAELAGLLPSELRPLPYVADQQGWQDRAS